MNRSTSPKYADLIAPELYDQWYATPRGEWIGRTETALLEALIGLGPVDSLLDVGCGTGYFTQAVSANALWTAGADRDLAMLHHAAGHRDGALTWLAADAQSLPFPDGAFDVVISVTALCFIQDERRAVAEFVRVARRRVVLGLLNRHSLLYQEQGRNGGRGGYRGARWHTAREARSLFDGFATANVETRCAVFLPSGGPLARWVEPTLGRWQAGWGSFLAVAADKKR